MSERDVEKMIDNVQSVHTSSLVAVPPSTFPFLVNKNPAGGNR